MPAPLSLQALLNDPRTGRLAFALCRSLPPGIGIPLAGWVGRRIASRRNTPLVQAFYANQWVVAGGNLQGAALDRAVQTCFEHIALGFYQLYRNQGSSAALESLVDFSPEVEALIARSQHKRHGLVVAGLHMSGFDLVVQTITRRGLQAISLSLPEGNQTVEWQHTLRRRSGMVLLPPTLANLRRVVGRVANGEMALTGIDRPMPDLKYRPVFFGRPALLPTHHIFLALRARVPIVVMGAILGSDGRYHVLASPELHMRSDPDRSREMVYNAEQVLEAAQEIICQAPEQWAVPYPVWPEVLAQIPA